MLRTQVDKGFRDTPHVVLAWSALGGGASIERRLDPMAGSGIPLDMRIAEAHRPEWSKDGATILIGLRPRQRSSQDQAAPGVRVECFLAIPRSSPL